ncbi:MAG: hypothetical protein AB1442_01565 [Nitrospirota bacterium]
MIRNMKLFRLLPVISAFFLVSCATTTVTDVWKDKAYQGKAQNIIVIMAAKSPDMREMFEDRFTAELRERGNSAIQSHSIIPMEQLRDKEMVKSKIRDSGADTVLISRLIDTKTIESYRPGLFHVVPDYYYGWWGYYGVVFKSDYGYTTDVQVADIETNLYDIKTEKLIWSAHSRTERTEGEQQLINAFIRAMMKKLSSSGIIK